MQFNITASNIVLPHTFVHTYTRINAVATLSMVLPDLLHNLSLADCRIFLRLANCHWTELQRYC